MNRRQWNGGNCKLYPMVKETITEYLKKENIFTLKWWHDWFVIFRMTEAGKARWAFSYSLVSLLDFGFYIQTGWD